MRSTKQIKAALRKENLAKMQALSPETKQKAPLLICDALQKLSDKEKPAIWQAAKKVSCFISMDNELNTRPILSALLKDGKQVFVPRIVDNPAYALGGLDSTGRKPRKQIMRMLKLECVEEIDLFAKSSYGIPEPPAEREELLQSGLVDLLLCPGVVFSPDGKRIGYGGGFYDMYIRGARKASPNVVVVGIGLACQVLRSDEADSQIPVDDTDELLDYVVTA